MNKRFTTFMVLIVALVLVSILPAAAQENVELRFMWYSDGVEGEVMRDLLDQFEAEHEGITVVLDELPYATLRDNIQTIVEAGEAPDLARFTNFSGMAGYYLDLSPYLSDTALLEDNFAAPVIAAFREDGDDEGLYGFPDSLTITAPYVNATLFELAEVEMPGEGATWDEWMTASSEVAEIAGLEYVVAMDNKGHRFAGPAMSMGATFFDEDGNFDLGDDEGFRAMAEIVKGWHDDGLTPREVWLGSGGQYTAGITFFTNVQVVMYFSGSWQVGAMTNDVGDAFDWVVAPNPSGPGGSTGVAGGSGIAAFNQTEHPEEVAMLMEYLLQPEVYAEYAGRSLLIPAHRGAIELGVEFDSDDPAVAAAFAQFAQEAAKLQDQAVLLNYHPFAFAYYDSSNTRLAQYFAGELDLDQAMERMQQDIDDAVANAAGG